jgi:FtsP/CotA-like multicopper oxidase with cupredoxin domain
MQYTRRDALKVGLFGSAALALPLQRAARGQSVLDNRMPSSMLPKPFTLPFRIPPVAVPVATHDGEDCYRIAIKEAQLEILPGFRTTVWAYDGIVPGPTIIVQQGRKAKVRFINQLPLRHPTLKYTPWTSVHLHGSASLPSDDGYASDITYPGEYKDYRYPNFQHARTLWYHDHGVHHTAENVNMGQAAHYHMYDAHERSLPLPQGVYDVPITISDRMFAKTGEFLFETNDDSGMYGDVILVNGVPWPAMKVARRKYRFRILNGSVSRAYEYSLSTGDPFTVIGTDGGLMPYPQTVTRMRHIMAERYEVVIDFSKYKPGTRIVLQNRNPKNNIAYANIDKIMAFDVTDEPFSSANNQVPAVLDPDCPVMNLKPSQSVATRRIELRRRHGLWTVNGHTWDDVIRSGFQLTEAKPIRDTVEIWELVNDSGGWQHPLHIHLIDFKLLDRNGRPPFPYELGPKDVVYLGENETVRVIAKFEGVGKYMIHCHNLVHEDHDMMSQFEVIDPNAPGEDPLSRRARNGSFEPDDPL